MYILLATIEHMSIGRKTSLLPCDKSIAQAHIGHGKAVLIIRLVRGRKLTAPEFIEAIHEAIKPGGIDGRPVVLYLNGDLSERWEAKAAYSSNDED